MTGAEKAYDELELMLGAIAGARRKNVAEARADLKAVRKELDGYFDQLLLEVGKSSRAVLINEAKDRVLSAIDGKEMGPEEQDPEEMVLGMISEARGALGWVVARPIDPVKVADVIARDREAARKAGHPVGPLKGAR